MGVTGRTAAWQYVLLLLALCAAQFAALGPAAAQSDQQHVRAEPEPFAEDLDAKIRRDHEAFDRLARSFSKKKRSELINLKTYTDAEWSQLERDVKANNAACRKGDAEACLAAGRAYETGDGVWIVPDIAFILYDEACTLGLSVGCRAFYDLAHSGFGYPEGGIEAAAAVLEKACTRGDLASCAVFVEDLRDTDKARSDAILDKACMAGGMEACTIFGGTLLAGQAPGDAQRGESILASACEKRAAAACVALADHLAARPGPDRVRVTTYRHLACHAGSALDCAEMGRRAYAGIGMAADRDRAVAYYAEACRIEDSSCAVFRALDAAPRLRSACDAGSAEACADLGLALIDYGSPEFHESGGVALLETSCRRGIAKACYPAVRVLQAYPDTAGRAAELLDTACTAGDLTSCFHQAQTFDHDPGSPDLERAVAIYSRLCDAEDERACELEERYNGLVASARIRPAGENYIAPLPVEDPDALLGPAEIREICFTGSERFRGKTYENFTCDRGEKGINSERARPGQAPWQALLWRPERLNGTVLRPAQRVLCGGSLIATGWVLTAAHCLTDEGNRLADKQVQARYRIRLGVFDPTAAQGISYPILRVIPHPQFDPGNKYAFDIALIQYDTRAARKDDTRPYRDPIHSITLDPVPVGVRQIRAGTPVYAFGWGWTAEQKSTSTDYLQIMKLDLSSEAKCTALTGFTKTLSNAALCAAGKNREQTCYGDSGGPLVHYDPASARPVLIGVVSAGKKCGTTGRLSQYTRVAKARDWIASYVPAIR